MRAKLAHPQNHILIKGLLGVVPNWEHSDPFGNLSPWGPAQENVAEQGFAFKYPLGLAYNH